MITASPRLGALLAGGAALVAFSLTAPVHADPKTGNGNGANQPCGAYCPNPGSPSNNGNGGGNATGRPAAGTVGNADSKNPPGQAPSGPGDANNGYECDGNNGIAKGNPAHTGCSDYPTPPPVTDPYGN